MMDKFYQKVSSKVRYTLESYTTASTGSTFPQSGHITADDFLKAGDALVDSSPNWSWKKWTEEGELPEYITRRKSKKDQDKHYLIFQNAPLDTTFKDLEDMDVGAGDDWSMNEDANPAPLTSDKPDSKPKKQVDEDPIVGSGDEDDEDGDIVWEEDDNVVEQTKDIRSYDVYIVYSVRWRAAQTFFNARSSRDGWLKPEEVLKDFSSEYRNKTVTVEVFPLSQKQTEYAGVHVCRIAEHIEKSVDRLAQRADRKASQNEGEGEEWDHISESIGVEHYFIMYLKIITSMIPNLAIDYTVSS